MELVILLATIEFCCHIALIKYRKYKYERIYKIQESKSTQL